MLTPEDARRLVRNRNDREHRAQMALDSRELEELDYLEESVAAYLSDSDFTEYVTDLIDEALPNAIDAHLPLYVGFSMDEFPHEDWHEDMRIGRMYRDPERDIYGCVFDPKPSGIEAGPDELAALFCETVRALYEDAGWEVSDQQKAYFFTFTRYPDGTPDRAVGPGKLGFDSSIPVSCFKIFC